MLHNICRGIRR